jgi:hypothetical protein
MANEHSLVDLLETATLENTEVYKINGAQRVKILEIFQDNPRYMTVALVHSNALYQCDVWCNRDRANNTRGALRVGEIVTMDFLDFMDGCCGGISCTYEVLIRD